VISSVVSNTTTMQKLSQHLFLAVSILAVLFLQSCTEQNVQLEKQKVQFTLSPVALSSGQAGEIDLPENAHAIVSVATSNGVAILSDHEIAVTKAGDVYVTDHVELTSGSYVITDFMIVSDSLDLYVTPKKNAAISASFIGALPYNFSVGQNQVPTVNMSVIDVRTEGSEKFGYSSSKAKGNTLPISVYNTNRSLTSATAELRQDKKLLSTFSLAARVNTISLPGDAKKPYTLTVYTATSANTQTFDMKKLKKEIGKNPLQITLKPALVLTIQSYVDAANEYEEYFEFRMDGHGAVNINWGDGEQSPATLPFEISHEYISGDYTAIITGDVSRVTDFSGFSYSSIISAITGLTNLTGLKVYDPSWGAVPIKVDLTNCKKLETINVAKYGAPYEPADLRTDFKLPTKHFINTFIFDAPSFDITREYISAEELEAMVNNVYNNVLARHIYNGKFFINPVVTPSPTTQQKLDVLKNQYNWQVGFNDEIYNAYNSDAGRSRSISDPTARREQWLRQRFVNSSRIIERAKMVSSLN
jgi:hypothetical protein